MKDAIKDYVWHIQGESASLQAHALEQASPPPEVQGTLGASADLTGPGENTGMRYQIISFWD